MGIQPAVGLESLLEPAYVGSSRGKLWGVVLAGGEGVRLRALVRRVCGDERPKQYVPLLERRTLLSQTLDRIALGIPPARTAVVTLRSHTAYFAQTSGNLRRFHLLVQPADRGTAAAILLSAQWVTEQDADAILTIFPSDHFILGEATFMAHITWIAAWVAQHPERVVLIGAQATAPEVEYGWIELGRPLNAEGDRRIWEVRRFWEKPSEEKARICLEAGCLWNTFVLVGKAVTFLSMGRAAAPAVSDRLDRLRPFLGTEDESWATHQAYALMPRLNFSQSVLEPCATSLAVADLPRVTWSDLGSPRRVFEILRRLRSMPSWVVGSDLTTS
jgi:mannose-1-phosphate guanylyltransferase